MSARAFLGLVALAAIAACSSSSSSDAPPAQDGGAVDAGPSEGGAARDADPGDAGPYFALDMNDVTILVPLPASPAAPVLLRGTDLADDGTSFVPRALFDRLVKDSEVGQPILFPDVHAKLQLVAVRFDLCDRSAPGECPAGSDARMRLVFQPIGDGGADDVGFHAFYTIRSEEIAEAVATLRDLAKRGGQKGALRPSAALADEAYASKLRAFVKRFGGEGRLVRLTVNAQPQIFAQIRWALRGVEKRGGAFADMTMVGATETSETVILSGQAGYDVTPATDTPAGLAGAISKSAFDAADATKKREYLAALAAVEDPMTHSAETVACVACHVSTVVMNARAASADIDPRSLPGRYTSKYDLSVAAGKSATTDRTLRALGWLGKEPMISQRVANDTAQTLAEIEKRYPAP
jgi:hypothetical protein